MAVSEDKLLFNYSMEGVCGSEVIMYALLGRYVVKSSCVVDT